MDEFQLKQMQMHEVCTIDGVTDVMRVPGGWIYSKYYYNGELGETVYSSQVFVPESTELTK